MKAKCCDECVKYIPAHKSGIDTWLSGDEVCSNGHRPRFYSPRSPLDLSWGYKRRCDDFTPKEER